MAKNCILILPNTVSIILFVLNVLGLFDLLLSNKKIINNFIVKQGNNAKHKIKDKKKEEYTELIGSLDLDVFDEIIEHSNNSNHKQNVLTITVPPKKNLHPFIKIGRNR